MEAIDVWCANDECSGMFQYKVETENMGEGSEHKEKCPHCGQVTCFEISYIPVTSNERLEEV